MINKKYKKKSNINCSEIIKNNKVFFNYELIEKFESGIILLGTEVKALRNRAVNIVNSYATIKKGELFIVNLFISHYRFGNINNHNPVRDRKLLLHKRELKRIYIKIKEQGLTLVPISLYFSRGKVKLELGLCRGKSIHDKREILKKKILDREMERYMKIKNS